mmetsp:Transcript_44506/g.141701  ORF Transcript_44506/g.141701 Transcript_44506/m.141701 type:complete len:218 (-) Transcript_44506:1900-2553(-)
MMSLRSLPRSEERRDPALARSYLSNSSLRRVRCVWRWSSRETKKSTRASSSLMRPPLYVPRRCGHSPSGASVYTTRVSGSSRYRFPPTLRVSSSHFCRGLPNPPAADLAGDLAVDTLREEVGDWSNVKVEGDWEVPPPAALEILRSYIWRARLRSWRVSFRLYPPSCMSSEMSTRWSDDVMIFAAGTTRLTRRAISSASREPSPEVSAFRNSDSRVV